MTHSRIRRCSSQVLSKRGTSFEIHGVCYRYYDLDFPLCAVCSVFLRRVGVWTFFLGAIVMKIVCLLPSFKVEASNVIFIAPLFFREQILLLFYKLVLFLNRNLIILTHIVYLVLLTKS